MYSSGARAVWLSDVASKIMDGGAHPPSVDSLLRQLPMHITTAINDGHVTAARAFGEKRRGDFKAGQRVIIEEMVEALRSQGLVNGNDGALRWTKPLDGKWSVQMDGLQYAVYGQKERRLSREVHMLGERSEADEHFKEGVFSSGKSRPFELDVIGPRGAITRRAYQVHPLALAIPPMTEKERETLRESIMNNGVLVPLLIFQDKILDGRNRGYYASEHKKPVRIEIFEGTENEARIRVAILNLHRRQLNAVQRAIAALRLFGEQAKKETTQAYIEKVGRPKIADQKSPLKLSEIFKPARSREWQEIVAREANKAGLNITASAIKAAKEIINAPQTLAKAERGQIHTITEAHRQAVQELGKPPMTEIIRAKTPSINERLGECIQHLNAILSDYNMPTGQMPNQLNLRLDEIEALTGKVRQVLRERKVIR